MVQTLETNTLIVNVLGKIVSFRLLEAKLQREWTKNGAIKITDLADGYFLVRFAIREDYIHALFEGPWKIAVTSLFKDGVLSSRYLPL